MLREQERSTVILDPIRSDEKEKTAITYSSDEPPSPLPTISSSTITKSLEQSQIEHIIHHYESLMQEMQSRFQQCLEALERSYTEL